MAAATDEQTRRRVRRAPAITTVQQRCWASSFPDDLLAVVYRMLASPRSRLRFVAVCRSWRAAAHKAPPVVALPWLLESPCNNSVLKHLHCPEDGTDVRLLVPNKAVGKSISGAYDGGWVISALTGPVRIVNLFTGVELALPEKQRRLVCSSENHGRHRGIVAWKTVCSESPTSAGCILASKTTRCGIALYKVGRPEGGWTIQGCPKDKVADIVFCKGKLYGLQYKGAIVRYEIGMNEDGAPVVTAEHQVAMKEPLHAGHFWVHGSYLFDLHGKLAIAIKIQWSLRFEPFFKVFEIVDIHAGRTNADYEHNWLELTSLGDHALFLGEKFSKMVHVPSNMRGNMERNCIYYTSNYFSDTQSVIPSDNLFPTTSNSSGGQTYYRKYDIGSSVVKRIRSVGYLTKDLSNGGMWILPPNI